MDKSNINRLNLIKEDTKGKYRLLFSFKRQDKEVADPWYTRDFERTYLDLVEGIEGLITYLKRYKKIKVSYENLEMKMKIKTYTGFTAQIIQHEIDHLNGIII